MNKYSDYAKSEIREFFYEDMPQFPFIIKAKPISKLNITNRRMITKMCKVLKRINIYEELTPFIKNISEDSDHQNLNLFEEEIVNTQGYLTLLHMYDIHYNIFERTVKFHTWEYLQQMNYINVANVEDFEEVVFLPSASNYEEECEDVWHRYGEWTSIVSFIHNSHAHKVIVIKQFGDHLILPLSEIMSFEYHDFDIQEIAHPPFEYPKFPLPDNLDDAKFYIDMLGAKNVSLPVSVFEVKTKC